MINYDKLLKIHDEQITFSTLSKFDFYLASLNHEESEYLYPELASNIIGVEEWIVNRLFAYATELVICQPRYEFICPKEDIVFYHTLDERDLEKDSVECSRCDDHAHSPQECEINISFKLLDIRNIKKKDHISTPISTPNNSSSLEFHVFQELLKNHKGNITINNNYYGDQVNLGDGSVANTGANTGSISTGNRSPINNSLVPPSSETKKDNSLFVKIAEFLEKNKTLLMLFGTVCFLLILIALYRMQVISGDDLKDWVKNLIKS